MVRNEIMHFLFEFGKQHVYLIIAMSVIAVIVLFRHARLGYILKQFPYVVIFKWIWRAGIVGLLIYALLGPYTENGKDKKDVKTVSKDIMVLLDLSLSMNSKDIAPNRLERAKHTIGQLIRQMKGDRMGIIIFSSSGYLLSPLTYDKNHLQFLLESTNSDLVPSSGTQFGPALSMALEKQVAETKTRNKAKVILLVSDGEDFSDGVSGILSDIEKEKIKLYTLGLGTLQGSKIPYKGSYKRDEDGKIVTSVLNHESLKKMAEQAKGKYFEISDRKNEANALITHINNIKGEVRDVKKISAPEQLQAHYFILAALIMIVMDFWFTFRTYRL